MNSAFLTLIGLNHNTAPVNIRERLFIPEPAIPDMLNRIKGLGINESLILSTCNRTEVYFYPAHSEASVLKVKDLLSEALGVSRSWLDDYTYVIHDEDACRHLFLVASGLDSLVIGEAEILGQVKGAYRMAVSCKATGFFLNKIFHRAFHVAKKSRTDTRIGRRPLSISSMAIELAKHIFTNLQKKKILVIGAGTMCRNALRYFRKDGITDICIANRTFPKAQQLAKETSGTAYKLEEVPELLATVDMVLTSTGSERPIIDKAVLNDIMAKRCDRPLLLIDIAVPRDIDQNVTEIGGVHLFNIDDLKDLSTKNLSKRVKESQRAKDIIEQEVRKFSIDLEELSMNPLIQHIVARAENMRSRELEKTLRKIGVVDESTIEAIEALTRTITNKLVHSHIALIKENGDATLLDIYRRYFHLGERNEETHHSRDKGQ